MTILTKENAREMYSKKNLDTLKNWNTEEISLFLQNIQQIKEEIEKYGLYYVAVDYDSYVIVIKYLIKKS